jgi:hypothetical protein
LKSVFFLLSQRLLYLKIKENVIKQALFGLHLLNKFSQSGFVNLCIDEVSFQDLALFIRKYSAYHTVSFSKTQKNLSETENGGGRLISCAHQQVYGLVFAEKAHALVCCLIAATQSKKPSLQQELQIFLDKPVAEPTRVHNARLFCAVLRCF